jgi:alpha-glucosidase
MYRAALKLRHELQTEEQLKWVWHFNKNVLNFKRPNGWQSITNFGAKPAKLPKGKVLLSSAPIVDGKLPANATAWIQA